MALKGVSRGGSAAGPGWAKGALSQLGATPASSTPASGSRTSDSHPITVSPITKMGEGKLGLCYCPGPARFSPVSLVQHRILFALPRFAPTLAAYTWILPPRRNQFHHMVLDCGECSAPAEKGHRRRQEPCAGRDQVGEGSRRRLETIEGDAQVKRQSGDPTAHAHNPTPLSHISPQRLVISHLLLHHHQGSIFPRHTAHPTSSLSSCFHSS